MKNCPNCGFNLDFKPSDTIYIDGHLNKIDWRNIDVDKRFINAYVFQIGYLNQKILTAHHSVPLEVYQGKRGSYTTGGHTYSAI